MTVNDLFPPESTVMVPAGLIEPFVPADAVSVKVDAGSESTVIVI